MRARMAALAKKLFGQWLVFFLLMCFIVTCCMELFVTLFVGAAGIQVTGEILGSAAKLTFLNVVLLSVICTAIDIIRRKFMVDRPVKQIINAVEQMMKGDFSVRIPTLHSWDNQNGFHVIAQYFNRMAGELSGLETLRTDFIANVSHELKTPLAVIQNYSTILQSPDLPEEKRMEYAKTVADSSRRFADLITNILNLNRLENQQIYPEKQTFNLGEQLAECLLNFESTWEKKEIDIDTAMDAEVYVESDTGLLTLVWKNL